MSGCTENGPQDKKISSKQSLILGLETQKNSEKLSIQIKVFVVCSDLQHSGAPPTLSWFCKNTNKFHTKKKKHKLTQTAAYCPHTATPDVTVHVQTKILIDKNKNKNGKMGGATLAAVQTALSTGGMLTSLLKGKDVHIVCPSKAASVLCLSHKKTRTHAHTHTRHISYKRISSAKSVSESNQLSRSVAPAAPTLTDGHQLLLC